MKTLLHSLLAAGALRALAWNSATTDLLWKEAGTSGDQSHGENLSVFTAFNSSPISGEEWIKIADYGEWRDGSKKRSLQIFRQEEAEIMAARFNSVVGQAGRFFMGAPIYEGHPDCDRQRYPNEKRLGKILQLEARSDGLYGRPQWNAKGRENLEEGYLVFPSAAWLCRKGKAGDPAVYPDLFKSLGLTNSPADYVEPVTFNAAPSDDDADEPENQKSMNPEILKLLGLEEGASEEDVVAALRVVLEKAGDGDSDADMKKLTAEKEAAENSYKEESKKREEAENALAEMQTEERDRLIGSAIGAGKLTAAEKPGWERRFETDHAEAVNAIGDLTADTGLNTKRIEIGSSKGQLADRQERIATFNAVVDDKVQQGMGYEVAFDETKEDPRFADLFEKKEEDAA